MLRRGRSRQEHFANYRGVIVQVERRRSRSEHATCVMLCCKFIARAPRFTLQVWNNLADFLHLLNLDMILSW